MRNIDMFTTEYGVASLTLTDVPYNACAYIRVHDTSNESEFTNECCDFCRAVGAEYIYATGLKSHEQYPLYTEIWKMVATRMDVSCDEDILVPVEESDLESWREIYNNRMKNVPMASFLSMADAKKLLSENACYFIRRNSLCVGLGVAKENQIHAVISLLPGMGGNVLSALVNGLNAEQVQLEVASENVRAIKLYERFGFRKTDVISTWYRIFP